MSEVRARLERVTPAEILAFEAAHPQHLPHREERIRHDLGISPVRYAVLLMRAAESSEGISAHPLTARLVRERLAERALARSRRTHGGTSVRA
ncbi:DUF3263 domain-containing protein [Microbacterium sp. STF-2]|uniref:DUF3263 domain-containing protein n=1 Tax=Microbacterium sp. STF-2 TaxID=3031132 RepID=UPI003A520D5A